MISGRTLALSIGGVLLFLLLSVLSGPAVASGDAAVYLHQARLGDLQVRTVHLGYLAPLSGVLSLFSPSVHEEVARVISLGCALLSLGAVAQLTHDQPASFSPRALLAMGLVLSFPSFVAQLGGVEVYLPQLCLLLWGMWGWQRGLIGVAGVCLGLAVLVSPTSLLYLPLLLAWPRPKALGVKVGLLMVVVGCGGILPHVDDYLNGPRGLFHLPPGDLDFGGAFLRGWRTIGPVWPAGLVAWGMAKGEKPWWVAGLSLVLLLLVWRHSDVPLLLPWAAWVAVWAAKGWQGTRSQGGVVGVMLVVQLGIAGRHWQQREGEWNRWQELCEEVRARITPHDRVVARWGEVRRLGWCLSEDPYDPRGIVWPGAGQSREGQAFLWPPGTSVEAFLTTLRTP